MHKTALINYYASSDERVRASRAPPAPAEACAALKSLASNSTPVYGQWLRLVASTRSRLEAIAGGPDGSSTDWPESHQNRSVSTQASSVFVGVAFSITAAKGFLVPYVVL